MKQCAAVFLLVITAHIIWDLIHTGPAAVALRCLMIADLITLRRLPSTGLSLPPTRVTGHNGSWTEIAGVMVWDPLLYRTLGYPIGERPPGDDVEDSAPGIPSKVFGACARCQRSWKWVSGHTTRHDEVAGMFVLCERCWGELTPQMRLPYYKKLHDFWIAENRETSPAHRRPAEFFTIQWGHIEQAVLDGK